VRACAVLRTIIFCRTWLQNLNAPLLERSKCELPLWMSNYSQFDNYFGGFNNNSENGITSAFKEDIVFDSFRHSVEECDRVDAVNIYVDVFDGFGGLCVSLLEEIRQELGSVSIPVWGLTSSLRYDPGTSSMSILSRQSELAKKASLPFVYNGIVEHSSMFVPIEPSFATNFLCEFNSGSKAQLLDPRCCSSLIAGAIDSAYDPMNRLQTSSQARSSVGVSVHQWGQFATANGQFPIGRLEGTTVDPFIKDNSGSASSVTGDTDKLFHSSLNPFMQSLSAINEITKGQTTTKRIRTRRPYSNVIGHYPLSKSGIQQKIIKLYYVVTVFCVARL
jgi:hypothetical protein